jgi:hypothetical protein
MWETRIACKVLNTKKENNIKMEISYVVGKLDSVA